MFREIVDAAQTYFYRVSTAVIILLGGLVLGILAKRIFQRVLREIKLNQITAKFRKGRNFEEIISSGASYAIYLLAFIFFLENLGLGSLAVYLLILVIVILFILSLAMDIKDFLPNLLGRFYIRCQLKLKTGRKIKINEIKGTIKNIGWTETLIITNKGDLLHVPNYLFYKNRIK